MCARFFGYHSHTHTHTFHTRRRRSANTLVIYIHLSTPRLTDVFCLPVTEYTYTHVYDINTYYGIMYVYANDV